MKNSQTTAALILGIMLVMISMAFTSALKIIPYERSLLTAKEKALISNKDVLVFFTSRECNPCNEIEKLINNDEEINSIVDDKLHCARIDVDNFDGKATQQRYDVRALPAMVIIDSRGKVKSKKENISSVREISEFIVRMPVYDETTFVRETPKPVAKTESSAPKKTIKEETIREILPEIGTESNFAVQIGVFGSKANAAQIQKKAKEKGFTDIYLIEEFVNGKNIVRVYCGRKMSKEAAESVKTKLESAGINGFVKNL